MRSCRAKQEYQAIVRAAGTFPRSFWVCILEWFLSWWILGELVRKLRLEVKWEVWSKWIKLENSSRIHGHILAAKWEVISVSRALELQFNALLHSAYPVSWKEMGSKNKTLHEPELGLAGVGCPPNKSLWRLGQYYGQNENEDKHPDKKIQQFWNYFLTSDYPKEKKNKTKLFQNKISQCLNFKNIEVKLVSFSEMK